jgi:PAP2 superfamily
MQTVASRSQAAAERSDIVAVEEPLPDHDPREAARQRQILSAVIAAVAAGIAVMAALGTYAFVWKTAVIPALLLAAVASRRANHFVADWSVFLGLMVLFDFLRGFVFALVTHFELPVYMHYAIAWERWLCGGHVIPVLLQQWRDGLAYAPLLDRLLTIVHGSHFAFFLLFGLALWLLRPAEFRRYAVALVLVTYASLVIYLLVPTVPPWMAAQNFEVLPVVEHVTAYIYNSELPSLQKAFDVNPIAAMPSLHAAWPTLGMLVAFHEFGWRGLYAALYAALAIFAIIYLGEHYVVDVVAGVFLSTLAFALVHGRTRLAGPRRSTPARSALVAAALVLSAEGIGVLTFHLVRPFQVTQSFVERELVGRTPRAHLHLGLLALHDGEIARARTEFALASHRLESPAQRYQAAALLARIADSPGLVCRLDDARCPVSGESGDRAP